MLNAGREHRSLYHCSWPSLLGFGWGMWGRGTQLALP